MQNIVSILKKMSPWLITIVLWRLSVSFWNPGGILALIPIFYYSFVRPIDGFSLFALLFCFLIDYRCDLVLFWTSIYCLFYAINGFQNYIDIENNNNQNAFYIFLCFVGFGIFVLTFSGWTFKNFINNIWLFIWLGVLYTPITGIDKWVQHDR